MGRRRRTTIAVAVVLLIGIAAGSPAAAGGAFDIAVPDALDVPSRTVSFQDETYTVDGTLRTDPGVERTVEVTAPDVVYRVYVYDKDQRIVESQRGNGSGTFAFDFAGYAPGSYALVVNHDGDFEDVFPVVVSGYTVTHDAPTSAEPGSTVEVSVDVTPTLADDPPAAVSVVVADAETSVREPAERSDGAYVATIDLSGLDDGTYTAWAVAQGEETAFGHQEVLGMSTPGTLEIAAPSTDGTADDGGSGSPSPVTSTTVGRSPATPATATVAGSPSATRPSTLDTTPTDAVSTTPPESTGDVITPAPPIDTPAVGGPPTSGGIPDATVGLAVLAAVSAGAVLWRRR